MRTYKNLIICTGRELGERGQAFELLEKAKNEIGVISIRNDGRNIRIYTAEKIIDQITYFFGKPQSLENDENIIIFPYTDIISKEEYAPIDIWGFKHLFKYYISNVKYKEFYKGNDEHTEYEYQAIGDKLNMIYSAITACDNCISEDSSIEKNLLHLIQDQRDKQELYEKAGKKLNLYLEFLTT